MCVDSQRLLINYISALSAIHMNKELLWSKAAGLLQRIYDTTVKCASDYYRTTALRTSKTSIYFYNL